MMPHAAHAPQLTRIGIIAALSLALAACAPALSNAPRPAATTAPPSRVITAPVPTPPPVIAPAPPQLPASEPPQVITAPLIEPAPPISAATSIGRATDVPVAPATAPAFSPPPPPITAPATPPASDKAAPLGRIVLVLPLQSSTFGPAAEAVEAGFRTAAGLANVQVEVISHGDGDVLAAIDKARAGQVKVLAGPLLRNDVKALTAVTQPLPWTIALNQVEDDVTLPERVYTLALSVEGEARQIARTMHGDGVRAVAIVASDSALQRRFASSFTGEWILLGGRPPATYSMVRAPDMLATLNQELQRVPPNAILLATDSADAALVKAYLPRVPLYASSQINERGSFPVMSDLDDIHFVEVPWLAHPEAPQFAGVPRRDHASTTLDRLYALGLDAFAVALAFDTGAPQRLDIDGATGHLSLDPTRRQVLRQGIFAHLEAGRVVPDLPH